MNVRKQMVWAAGLGLAFAMAGGARASAAVVTLLSEDFSGFTAGMQSTTDDDHPATATNGWTIKNYSNSSVYIVNSGNTGNSNALAFDKPEEGSSAYISKSFEPATRNNFQFSFDLAQLEGYTESNAITGNQTQLRVYDSDGNYFSIRFTNYGRATVSWPGGSENNIISYNYTSINRLTLTYDGEMGTLAFDSPRFSDVIATGLSLDFKAAEIRILSSSTSAVNYSEPQLMVDNLELTTVVPEPASLGLMGLGAGMLLLRRRRQLESQA